MLVYNGSLLNIIFGTTFDKIEVDHDLTTMNSALHSFTGDNIIPRGKITIGTEMETTPLTGHHFMIFLVVDNRSANHGVLGRPSLKKL